MKWYTTSEYAKKTGLNKHAIMSLIKSGKLEHTTTEGGGRFLIRYDQDDDILALKEDLAETKLILLRLCAHLGIQTN